ncbi:MAG: hypothetical protein LLG45_10875, partial [Actinomycetia bacterium]|nr:hypothetical protein [Actinomycetes bacterium]
MNLASTEASGTDEVQGTVEVPGPAAIPVYVLDSFALLSLVCEEAGAARVQEVLSNAGRGRCRALLSLLSLVECAYIVERRRGIIGAQKLLSLVEDLPLEVVGVDRRAGLSAAACEGSPPRRLSGRLCRGTRPRRRGDGLGRR